MANRVLELGRNQEDTTREGGHLLLSSRLPTLLTPAQLGGKPSQLMYRELKDSLWEYNEEQ